MNNDAVRKYASDRGATVLLYPLAGREPATMPPSVNETAIDAMKLIFGAWRWPSKG